MTANGSARGFPQSSTLEKIEDEDPVIAPRNLRRHVTWLRADAAGLAGLARDDLAPTHGLSLPARPFPRSLAAVISTATR